MKRGGRREGGRAQSVWDWTQGSNESREHFLLMEQEPFLNIGVFKTDLAIFPVPSHSLALYLPTQERFLCSCTSIWSYCDSKDATVGTIWGYNFSSLAHLSHGV